MILSKGNPTRNTIVAVESEETNGNKHLGMFRISVASHITEQHNLRLGGLFGETLATNDFLHGESVNGMVGFFGSLWIGHAWIHGHGRTPGVAPRVGLLANDAGR